MRLHEILGLTLTNGQYQQPVLYKVLAVGKPMEPVHLPGWAEAPFAGYLVCKYIERLHLAPPQEIFPQVLELFAGQFWRRAAWGHLRILGHTDHHSPAQARELAEDEPWVQRDRCAGWTLSTALYAGGFLALLTYDEGPHPFHVWLELEAMNHGNGA